ncbi:MAG: glycosyltransferase family 4 protein [Bryobacteraceae bacterium]|nr:glycosyltransferase family 4 protein [Bryobacteraceae bacterium]
MAITPGRVLMVAETTEPAWPCVLDLAQSLARRRIEVTLASTPLTSQIRDELAGLERVRIYEEPKENSSRWLLDLEQTTKPDIVHVHGFRSGGLAWKSPVLVSAYSCELARWLADKKEASPAVLNRYDLQVRLSLQKADVLVTPSDALRRQLESFFKALPETRVVRCGRDPKRFRISWKESLIAAFGPYWDDPVNLANLDAVAAHLPWPIVVPVEDPEAIQRMFRPQAIRLIPAGAKERLELLSRASIYIHPAAYDVVGFPAIDAAMSGCSLILGENEGMRDMWEDTVRYVPPYDRLALGAAIIELIQKPAERHTLAEKAEQMARRYTSERMALGYLTAYERMLGRRSGSAKADLAQAV